MIKEVLQILIITFLVILCYDTIGIYLNQSNSKKEKELLLIKREIEGTKKHFNETIPNEASYFAVWPIVLGFSSVFCFILYRYFQPANYACSRKEVIKVPTCSKDDIVKGKNNGNRKSTYNLKKLNKTKTQYENHSKATIKNEVSSAKDSNIKYYNLPGKEGKLVANISIHSDDIPFKEGREAFIGITEQNLFLASTPNTLNTEMLPLSSTLNILSNDSISLSGSSLIQYSENLCDIISEKRNISEIGFPLHKSQYTDEYGAGKPMIAKKCLERDGDLLKVKKHRLLVDKETDFKSDDSTIDMSILANKDQIMELLSTYRNNNGQHQQKRISDKASWAQLLTFSDNDIKNIEKRLEAIEVGLKKSEDRTKDWGCRINVAEMELVDLHEQMYTLFSKIEEEKKSNYIIVSQVSKEDKSNKCKENKESTVISDADETVAEYDEDNNQSSKKEIKNDCLSTYTDEPISSVNEENEVTSHGLIKSTNKQDNENDVNHPSKYKKAKHKKNSKIPIGKNKLSVESCLVLNEMKNKSIGLEAYIANETEAIISANNPRKVPILNVPPHILPPHKRSTYAGTDSNYDFVKRNKFKTLSVSNDSAWRTKAR